MITNATGPPRCSRPLDVLTGVVIGQCLPRHRHQEFVKFLRTIDREVPKDLSDSPTSTTTPPTNTPPCGPSSTGIPVSTPLHPTSSSWLNLVERWFRELTDKALRRGVFHSMPRPRSPRSRRYLATPTTKTPSSMSGPRPGPHPRESRPADASRSKKSTNQRHTTSL